MANMVEIAQSIRGERGVQSPREAITAIAKLLAPKNGEMTFLSVEPILTASMAPACDSNGAERHVPALAFVREHRNHVSAFQTGTPSHTDITYTRAVVYLPEGMQSTEPGVETASDEDAACLVEDPRFARTIGEWVHSAIDAGGLEQ